MNPILRVIIFCLTYTLASRWFQHERQTRGMNNLIRIARMAQTPYEIAEVEMAISAIVRAEPKFIKKLEKKGLFVKNMYGQYSFTKEGMDVY